MKSFHVNWLKTAVMLAVVSGIALSARVDAQITTFSNRASWLAATSGVTDIDFEGIASDGSFANVSVPPGITLSGVNFTIDTGASNGFLFVIGKDFYYPGNSVLSSQQSSTAENNIAITLPGGFKAIGFDLGDFFGTVTATVELSTGDTTTITPPALPGLQYLGITSLADITSLKISSSSGETVLNLDNFSFGGASSVPEPGSIALLAGLGTSAITVIRRRKRA